MKLNIEACTEAELDQIHDYCNETGCLVCSGQYTGLRIVLFKGLPCVCPLCDEHQAVTDAVLRSAVEMLTREVPVED